MKAANGVCQMKFIFEERCDRTQHVEKIPVEGKRQIRQPCEAISMKGLMYHSAKRSIT